LTESEACDLFLPSLVTIPRVASYSRWYSTFTTTRNELSGYVHTDMSTMSPESGFRFTACTSFTSMSGRSWSLVEGQLNAYLPTISRKIE